MAAINDFSSSLNTPDINLVWRLAASIGAVQVSRTNPHGDGSGVFTRLLPGEVLTIEGGGFNERTVQVQCRGESYVVFWEDLMNERAALEKCLNLSKKHSDQPKNVATSH